MCFGVPTKPEKVTLAQYLAVAGAWHPGPVGAFVDWAVKYGNGYVLEVQTSPAKLTRPTYFGEQEI